MEIFPSHIQVYGYNLTDFTVRFTSFDGIRRELYGFTNERLAQRLGTKLDDLVAAHKMGTIPEELKIWLQKLDPNIRVKLAQ